jgi:hypothetical protein
VSCAVGRKPVVAAPAAGPERRIPLAEVAFSLLDRLVSLPSEAATLVR